MLLAVERLVLRLALTLLAVSANLVGCGMNTPNPFAPHHPANDLALSGSVGANGYPYCTNGSNTGGGYGWDPSVTDPKGSHSCLVPSGSPNGIPNNGGALPALSVGAPGNASFGIHNYGSTERERERGEAAWKS